jgi:uncharacterized protein (DUF952 family)
MKKMTWEERKNKEFWGQRNINADGFIHCSTIEYFWRVAENFISAKDEMVLLCIDEDKLQSEVKYEDGDNCGRLYPHVYGLINNDAVIQVLPFLKNEDGTWIKNSEIADIQDK